jgi:hypothetical protein
LIPPVGKGDYPPSREHDTQSPIIHAIREELGLNVVDLRLLGVLENIFEYEGKPRQGIVFAYDGRLEDSSAYEPVSY